MGPIRARRGPQGTRMDPNVSRTPIQVHRVIHQGSSGPVHTASGDPLGPTSKHSAPRKWGFLFKSCHVQGAASWVDLPCGHVATCCGSCWVSSGLLLGLRHMLTSDWVLLSLIRALAGPTGTRTGLYLTRTPIWIHRVIRQGLLGPQCRIISAEVGVPSGFHQNPDLT